MKVLVIAPHPDDEIIGVGGTIAKRANAGDNVYVCIVTKGQEPVFKKEYIEIGSIYYWCHYRDFCCNGRRIRIQKRKMFYFVYPSDRKTRYIEPEMILFLLIER